MLAIDLVLYVVMSVNYVYLKYICHQAGPHCKQAIVAL